MEQIKGFDYEHKKVNSKYLVCDTYQRTLDYARVKRTVSEYDPNVVNEIKVSYRDGKYYVVDGQHTLKEIVLHNNGKDLMVDCKVFYGMTYQDEARLFAKQNGISRSVESGQKLFALYESEDSSVVDFKNAVEELGIACSFKRLGGPTRNSLGCYKSVFDIYTKHGRKHLQEVLKTILEIWNGEGESLRKEIIIGMDMFIRTYKGDYNRYLLVKKLSAVSPITLYRDANAFVTGGNKRYGRMILHYYNKNTSTNRLDDKF